MPSHQLRSSPVRSRGKGGRHINYQLSYLFLEWSVCKLFMASTKAQFRHLTFHEPNLIHWIKYLKSSAPESIRNTCFNLEQLSCSFCLAKPGISSLQGFWYFARSRTHEIQVFLWNPAKFPKKREIPRNLPEIFPNTCRQNIFNTYLGYYTCFIHPKRPNLS